MVVNKSTKPAERFRVSSFLAHHFYGKQILQHVPFVPFSGRGGFNLLTATGASFSRLLLEEAIPLRRCVCLARAFQ
jgi:hypothetical protein